MVDLNFKDLKGKVCAITGGAGIIGSSIALGLADAGVKIALLDINEQAALTVADDIQTKTGTQVQGYKTDVLSKQSLEEVHDRIRDDLGNISFLINGAGGNSPKATTKIETLQETDPDELDKSFYGLNMEGFEWVYALNFKGTLLPTQILTRDMLKQKEGVVLNISSMTAFRPITKVPAYAAAKASINNFTQWLSVHLAPVGIRVNAMAPGFFLTQQNRFLLTDEKTGEPTARGEKIISQTPMARYGEVDELQGTVLYLLSDISKFVTGACIPVDGGYSAFGGV